jgi:hypothetical protein
VTTFTSTRAKLQQEHSEEKSDGNLGAKHLRDSLIVENGESLKAHTFKKEELDLALGTAKESEAEQLAHCKKINAATKAWRPERSEAPVRGINSNKHQAQD